MSGKYVKLGGIALVLVLALTVVIFLNSDRTSDNGYPPDGQKTGDVKKAANEINFPEQLGGMRLEQSVSGPQAIDMISQLHGTGISIRQGYITSYAGAQGKIMIWVSESDTSEEAGQLFDIMDRKIIEANTSEGTAAGGPPFTDRRTMTQNGIDVVAVKGMGMENYYYRTGSLVYWIAVEGPEPEQILEEAVDKLSLK